jgi:hypothetical protein
MLPAFKNETLSREQLAEWSIHQRDVYSVFRSRAQTQPAHHVTHEQHRQKEAGVCIAGPLDLKPAASTAFSKLGNV